jgi:hypothetical protein
MVLPAGYEVFGIDNRFASVKVGPNSYLKNIKNVINCKKIL